MPSAYVRATASGITALVAAVSGKVIRVHSLVITAKTAVDYTQIRSGATTVLFECSATSVASGGVSLSYARDGYVETALSEALNVNLSGAADVSVFVVYSLVG